MLPKQLQSAAASGSGRYRLNSPGKQSPSLAKDPRLPMAELAKRCWRHDPAHRPTFAQLQRELELAASQRGVTRPKARAVLPVEEASEAEDSGRSELNSGRSELHEHGTAAALKPAAPTAADAAPTLASQTQLQQQSSATETVQVQVLSDRASVAASGGIAQQSGTFCGNVATAPGVGWLRGAHSLLAALAARIVLHPLFYAILFGMLLAKVLSFQFRQSQILQTVSGTRAIGAQLGILSGNVTGGIPTPLTFTALRSHSQPCHHINRLPFSTAHVHSPPFTFTGGFPAPLTFDGRTCLPLPPQYDLVTNSAQRSTIPIVYGCVCHLICLAQVTCPLACSLSSSTLTSTRLLLRAGSCTPRSLP